MAPPFEFIALRNLPNTSAIRPWDRNDIDSFAWNEPEIPTISARTLGCEGRWGNSLLQYIFLKAFAAKYRLNLETADWIGKHLFELADPVASRRYKAFVLDGISRIYQPRHWALRLLDMRRERAGYVAKTGRPVYMLTSGGQGSEDKVPFTAAEIEGLFLVHTSLLANYKDLIFSSLRPVRQLDETMRRATRKLRSLGKTVVGLHIRRGDFVTSNLAQGFELLTPVAAYRRWLEAIWPQLADPVLLVCSDDKDIIHEFHDYKPVHFEALGIQLGDLAPTQSLPDNQLQQSADFFPDWYLLTQCDVMAISNSTFSFSAALLNQTARLFVRPSLDCEALIKFDPWDSEPLLLVEAHAFLPCEVFRRISLSLGQESVVNKVNISLYTYARIVYGRMRFVFLNSGRLGLLKILLNHRAYFDTYFRVD